MAAKWKGHDQNLSFKPLFLETGAYSRKLETDMCVARAPSPAAFAMSVTTSPSSSKILSSRVSRSEVREESTDPYTKHNPPTRYKDSNRKSEIAASLVNRTSKIVLPSGEGPVPRFDVPS